MSGRKSKLSASLQNEIVELLQKGNTVEDICSQVGISDRTFYNWRDRGEKEANRLDDNPRAHVRKNEEPFLQFFQATTRAQKHAKVKAVNVIYDAFEGVETVERTREFFKETRLRKVKDGDNIVEEPYEYERTSRSRKVIQHAPDPRIAIEYLKRRYPDEWSDRLKLEVDPALVKELKTLAASAGLKLAELIQALVEELKSNDDSLAADSS